MNDLTVQLERPLPDVLRVGRGTAWRIDVVARPQARIVDLSLIVGDDEYPIIDFADPAGDAQRARWSVLIDFAPVERPTVVPVQARARLRDGPGPTTVRLGAIRLTPDIEPGLGAERLLAARETLAGRAARTREEHPDTPLVAIAMATFDPELSLFERQIESIRHQSHPGWVCVISDDRSPAKALAGMRGVLADDPRFLLLTSSTRRGAFTNFERALVAMPPSADFVALSDQTDHWYPEKLETLIGRFDPGVLLAYGDLRVPGPPSENGDDDRTWHSRERSASTLDSLLASSTVPGSASLFTRELLDYALPFPDPAEGIRHDQWLALVAVARGELRSAGMPLSDRLEPESGFASPTGPDSAAKAPSQAAARTLVLRCGDRLDREQLALLEAAAQPSERTRKSAGWLRSLRARMRSGDGSWRMRPWPTLGGRRRTKPPRRPMVGGSRTAAGSAGSARRAADPPAPVSARPQAAAPPAIVVEGVRKSFRIPAHRQRTVKELIRHPLANARHERFDALADISFEVARGEFFGIVGRNGSGKSTLLQILANVYRPDEGAVMIAPRVAPLISLGVGFQPELPALENVVLTAGLMGVPAAEAQRRFPEVLEFAELEDFADLKLKNFSTGMRVRLAFATVLLVDADVLLLDELLAVGDEAFKRKAGDAFTQLLANKTVVLVTHQTSNLQRFCNRAMLLEGGRIELIGTPDEISDRYAELTLEGHGEDAVLPHREPRSARRRRPLAEIEDLWLEDADGERTFRVSSDEEIVVRAAVEVSAPLENPGVRLEIRNKADARIFAPPTVDLEPKARRLRRGERLELETAVENKLAAGPYTVICTVIARPEGAERVASSARSARFMVSAGPSDTGGVIDLKHRVRITERHRGGRRRGGSV